MIPFEKSLSLSSYRAYFSYEEKLHLYDPVLHNMVSELYHASAYEDDYSDDGEEDSDSVSDEDEDAIASIDSRCAELEVEEEIGHCDLVFGNFGNSDPETIPSDSASITLIKPEIEGFTIKIGEITCSLVSVNGSEDSRSNTEKCETVEEPPVQSSSFTKIRTPSDIKYGERLWFDLSFYATDLNHPTRFCNASTFIAKEMVRVSWFELVSEIAKPSPAKAVDHADLISITSPQYSTFLLDPGGTGTIPPCVIIAIFDPGGVHHFHFRSAIVVSNSLFSEESVIDPLDFSLGFIRIQRCSSFVFDPGGNHICSLPESPQPPWASIFSPEPPWDMLHHGHRPYDPGGFEFQNLPSVNRVCALFSPLRMCASFQHSRSFFLNTPCRLKCESGPSWACVAAMLLGPVLLQFDDCIFGPMPQYHFTCFHNI